MENTFWIWYPGDFELYHAMKQNFSRVERGFGWPAFWKSEGFRNRVAFRRTYELEQETSFTVFSNAIGHVLVTRENGEKEISIWKEDYSSTWKGADLYSCRLCGGISLRLCAG